MNGTAAVEPTGKFTKRHALIHVAAGECLDCGKPVWLVRTPGHLACSDEEPVVVGGSARTSGHECGGVTKVWAVALKPPPDAPGRSLGSLVFGHRLADVSREVCPACDRAVYRVRRPRGDKCDLMDRITLVASERAGDPQGATHVCRPKPGRGGGG